MVEIRVPAGDGPHLAYGRAFYRSGPATVAMTRAEYERRLLDRLREASGFERRTESDWTQDLLDEQAARGFVEEARRRGRSPAEPEPALDPGSPRQLLERLHLIREQRLTVGGILLFGRAPQGPLPQATIRARARRGALEDVEGIEGNLFAQIELAVRFVSRNLKVRARRDAPVRQEQAELPTAAVREVVANAIAHRDYRSTAPIQLRLDDNGLILWNPGHFPAPITAASLRGEHPSVPTNPLIARALYLAGYIEEWGTGTNRVIAAMAANGNPEPTFDDVTQPGGIRVVLPLPDAIPSGLSDRQAGFLASMKAGERFTTVSYATATGIAPRTALNDLKQLRFLGLVEAEGQGKASRWVRR
jgi:ATP-dependent DNA helicase RecG